MQVIYDPQKLTLALKKLSKNKTIGFVPTMGALHAGHLSLIKQAAHDNQIVLVSIFVNPTQFGPGEDLKQYPRQLKKDVELCREQLVDFVFQPDNKTMYPDGYSTFIDVEGLSRLLCGAFRPGHFRGVATVIAKLLNIVKPDNLYLGQKDAQQVVIIARLIKDLNFKVRLKIMPTVRYNDGLALSSRNIYLKKEERIEAVILYKALQLAKSLVDNGQRNALVIINRMRQLIAKKKLARVDYISIVDLNNLKPLNKLSGNCLIALAVKIGKVRLIDNLMIDCI